MDGWMDRWMGGWGVKVGRYVRTEVSVLLQLTGVSRYLVGWQEGRLLIALPAGRRCLCLRGRNSMPVVHQPHVQPPGKA